MSAAVRSGAACLAVLLLSTATAAAQSEAAPCGRPCREHPERIGECFPLRGRLRLYNGAPTLRIWRVGSRRVLGVSEGRFLIAGYCAIPDALRAMLAWDTDLYADFTVCPFTVDQPGVMRMVCVDSASRIRLRTHQGVSR